MWRERERGREGGREEKKKRRAASFFFYFFFFFTCDVPEGRKEIGGGLGSENSMQKDLRERMRAGQLYKRLGPGGWRGRGRERARETDGERVGEVMLYVV